MSVAIITGATGLVGSEAARYFGSKGLQIVGIDNDMRARFFGPQASTAWMQHELTRLVRGYQHYNVDVRDSESIFQIFEKLGKRIDLVVHAAAQPSHDWAAREPLTDFAINGTGTLNVLEATRRSAPEAVFIFMSTNKVYGDRPNALPLLEQPLRWELNPQHSFFDKGIPEEMPVDQSMHSIFGVSKLAADLMVQEYARRFGMKTVCFRAGCITGANHCATELHGFLAHLVGCNLTASHYTVFGYKGKQVRDNLHASDLMRAFARFFERPRPGEVYNIGGSRRSNCSVLEAIKICEEISRPMTWSYVEASRPGDHIWWISDISKFQSHYPGYEVRLGPRDILCDLFDRRARREKSIETGLTA